MDDTHTNFNNMKKELPGNSHDGTEEPISDGDSDSRKNDDGEKNESPSTDDYDNDEDENQTPLGSIVGKYTCFHNLHKGILHLGSKALMFKGNAFGLETEFCIDLADITDLSRVNSHSIRIKSSSTAYGINRENFFKDFENRDVVISVLYELIKNGPGGYATSQRALCAIASMAQLNPDLLRSMADINPVIQMDKVELDALYNENPDTDENNNTMTIQKENDNKSSWLELKTKIFSPLKVNVVNKIALECSLDTFIEKFVENGAEFSIGNYLLSLGDFDVVTTEWNKENNDDNSDGSEMRTVTYNHPMNIPMAPPQARATKTQHLYKNSYSSSTSSSIMISTSTQTFDAPATDCFTVQDVLLVEQQQQEKEGGSQSPSQVLTELSISFQVLFVKHTIFQKFVEMTTNAEFNKVLGGYAQMIQDKINSKTADEKGESEASGVVKVGNEKITAKEGARSEEMKDTLLFGSTSDETNVDSNDTLHYFLHSLKTKLFSVFNILDRLKAFSFTFSIEHFIILCLFNLLVILQIRHLRFKVVSLEETLMDLKNMQKEVLVNVKKLNGN